MAELSFNINLSRPVHHTDLVQQLCTAFSLVAGDLAIMNIKIPSRSFLYSDNLLILTSVIDHLKEQGIAVQTVVEGTNTYAARVNFYRLLDAEFEEALIRRNNTGRFIELKTFDSESMYSLQDELNMILYQINGIPKEVLELLFYCLGEIIDNTIVHSGLRKGWVSAQYFPQNQEIRLIICDNGKGIHQSLIGNEKYHGITEAEALKLSIERGVTDGQGLGFGLFATAQFIKKNEGELLVYSGDHYLFKEQEEYKVAEGSKWQGTLVFLRINTNVKVNYKDIMPEHSTLPDDYDFFIDKFFGDENELW